MPVDVHQIKDRVQQQAEVLHRLHSELSKAIVGQKEMISRLLVGLLTDGHILLEGVPGLAKTTAIKSLAQALATEFPADSVHARPAAGRPGRHDDLRPGRGHVPHAQGADLRQFHSGRRDQPRPSKVQSALLEAMQERQVTIGDAHLSAGRPVSGDGHAEPDRAGRHVSAARGAGRSLHAQGEDHLSRSRRGAESARHGAGRLGADGQAGACSRTTSSAMQEVVKMIYIDDQVKHYILNLVRATRDPAAFGMKTLEPLIDYGASPRASIYLGAGRRAIAFLPAAATSRRRTSRTSPTTCCATG